VYETTDERNKFYWSKEWRAMREYILQRDNYECIQCKRQGIVTSHDVATLIVDHILELKDRPDLRLDEDNLQVLCHYHHELKHDRIFKGNEFRKKSKWSDDEWW